MEFPALLPEGHEDTYKSNLVEVGKFSMKFHKLVLGKRPQKGRSLYISMHGGGHAPAHVNEQQWNNQIRLYFPKEGVVIAPRAPTNNWNLWHEPHMDGLLEQLILMAHLFDDVNLDRVYLMGYSAGGDGVFQLAPRMADRFAAASMMAGHPNESLPLGLRNLPFMIHVGEFDYGVKRNKACVDWSEKIEALKKKDQEGYINHLHVAKGMGHWMNRKDHYAVDWMADYDRNAFPSKVAWRQDNVLHSQFYWLSVDKEHMKKHTEIVASRKGQEIVIDRVKDIESINIMLNDEMLDLDKKIKIKYKEKVLFEGLVKRDVAVLENSIRQRSDEKLLFSAKVSVDLSMEQKGS